MSELNYVILPHRGVLRVSGRDRLAFLQGLVTGDVSKVSPERAIWSAFLTAQGKFLHEFFIAEKDEAYLLECERARRDDLLRRLGLYKLRSQVTIEDVAEESVVAAVIGTGITDAFALTEEEGRATALDGGVAFVDPRLAALGIRTILPAGEGEGILADRGLARVDDSAYERLRIGLGVPDGSRDLEVDRSTLLEYGFDELKGVDWKKGCFLGQELTARMKYRGLAKKRLLPVEFDGAAPDPGTPVMYEGKETGAVRSTVDNMGLAHLRLESVEAAGGANAFTAGDARLRVLKPDWATF